MKFETINKSNKKYIIIGIILFCILGSVIVLKTTRAKYRTAQSIPFVRGTITYSNADLNILAVNIENGPNSGVYQKTKEMPGTGYYLNYDKSYCEVDGVRDNNIKMSYNYANERVTISDIGKQGTKCYIYFDKHNKFEARNAILSNITTIAERTNFTTLTDDTTGTIYTAEDDDETTYYFAGAVTNNWIKFAGFYWRIIRINGDGTLRIIYSGEANGSVSSANKTGTTTQIKLRTDVYHRFNESSGNNKYVGYMYADGEVHGLKTSSTIKYSIDEWYETNLNQVGIKEHIDSNAGFCGDRDNYTDGAGTTQGGGTGTDRTYYGAFIRFYCKTNPIPTYKCKNESDLYTVGGTAATNAGYATSSKGNKILTYPVGLITADEVVYAGSINGATNKSYYLYTGERNWTMSPSYHENYATVYEVYTDGSLNVSMPTNGLGVRPVINLKADTKFAEGGKGTETEPYVIS